MEKNSTDRSFERDVAQARLRAAQARMDAEWPASDRNRGDQLALRISLRQLSDDDVRALAASDSPAILLGQAMEAYRLARKSLMHTITTQAAEKAEEAEIDRMTALPFGKAARSVDRAN